VIYIVGLDYMLFPLLYTPLSGPWQQMGWFAVVYVDNANHKPNKTYRSNSSSCFDSLHHSVNYLMS